MAARQFYLPFRPALDANMKTIPGAQAWFTLPGTNTPVAVYSDNVLAIPRTNPIVANAIGRFPVSYMDDAIEYRVRIYDEDAVVGVDTPLEDYDPYIPIEAGVAANAVDLDDLADESGDDGLGADMVGFLASGTGAVGRSVRDKLRDFVSVKDFGAVGDGTTNDTAAVTAALAEGREVWFPAGNYLISPIALSALAKIKLRGAGRDVTKITLASTGTALTFSNCHWVQISDISFEASGTAQTLANARGILFDTSTSNSIVERCNFYGFSLGGMKQLGTAIATLSGHVVRNCYFLGNGGNQLHMEYSNDWTIDDNQFGRLAGIALADFGVFLQDASAGTYTKNKHWDNEVALAATNCSFNGYSANRFEESQNQNVFMNGGSYNNFVGNRLHTASKSGDGDYDNFYAIAVQQLNFTGNTIFSWNASFSRYGVNFDTGCSELVIGKNTVRGYDTTNFGPFRFEGAIDQFSADLLLHGTATGVAAAATVHMSNGTITAEQASWFPVNRRYQVARIYAATDVAPGAAQTFTYTLRKNGADTGQTAVSSGAASLAAAANNIAPAILLNTGDYASLKVVSSAGATAGSNHRFYIALVEY
jgi:hypothetical protein